MKTNKPSWQQNLLGRQTILRDNQDKTHETAEKTSETVGMTSQFPNDATPSNRHDVTTDSTETSSDSHNTPSQVEELEEDAMSFDMKIREKKFQILAQKYAINDTLIVAVTDLGYIEMALNLYESSFKRFNIDNYLFVCSHEKAEQYLASRNIHAISLWNDSLSTKESLYSGKGYRNKTNFKTDSVLMTLRLGLSVFLVDVDLVFLKNPMPYISQFSSTHDIIIQGGLTTLNSGKVKH